MEDKERKKRQERKRRVLNHKLFYSYPALLMYVGMVNNTSAPRIIRTTTLLFFLTHTSRLTM